MNICLYGASSPDIDSLYIEAVEELGRQMARRGHSMVYGGGANGLMGAAARGMSAEGGHIIGVAPKFFDNPGILYEKCDDFIFTETMAERKQIMEDKADAFLVVPGGIGTYEEFFQVLTLKQLKQLNKPIGIFNVNRYYDAMDALLRQTVENGFMREGCLHIYGLFEEVENLLTYLEEELKAPLNLDHLKFF